MTRRMARPRRPSSSGTRVEGLSADIFSSPSPWMTNEFTVLSFFLSIVYVAFDNTSLLCYHFRELAALFRSFRDHAPGLWSRFLSPFPSCTYKLQIFATPLF